MTVELIGWGVIFFDFDNDGDLDLYVANGCISGTANDGQLGCTWNSGFSTELPHANILFSNNGDGTFMDVSDFSGLANSYLTTGAAIGDINNDGFYDIYEVNELDSSPSSNHCRLYKNNFGEINPGIRWIKVKLEGVASNRNAIGSRIYISQQDGVLQQIREINSGESYSSQSSYTASFGTGSLALIDTLKISWPSGLVQYHYNIDPNQTHYIVEGQNSDELSCLFPVENYDCEGNCLVEVDCSGECGGILVFDECGVCGGSGSNDTGCGCFEAGPSGCDNTCGSTLVDDACGVCDGDGSDDVGCGCFVAGPSGCDNTCGSILEDDACDVCGGDNTTCTGCMHNVACNYDDNALIGGPCDYAQENYDCDGNCMLTGGENDDGYDCNNVCGGTDTSCLSIENSIPENFSINSIHPNPFNPIVTITYGIPTSQYTEGHIYNLSGELVHTLISQYQSAGNYSIEWNAFTKPSGIYIFILKSESDVQSQKLVLLK